MKISQTILCVAVACLMSSFSGVSVAQETSPDSRTQKTQVETKQQKKKAERPSFMAAVEASVTDLTDDQKSKLDALRKEAGAKHKEIHTANGITWEMSKKREKILKGMSVKKPFKERNVEASTQAGYSDEQFKKLKDIGQVYSAFRFNGMKVLTAAQRAKMPEWYRDEFKKASDAAATKAAKDEKQKAKK